MIGLGSIVAVFTALAGLFWASKAISNLTCGEDMEESASYEQLKAQYGQLPSPIKAFSPILVPILFICLASIANYPTRPFGDGTFLHTLLLFLGVPMNALMVGLGLAITLIQGEKRMSQLRI